MTVFLLFAALMLAGALFFVIPPLLQRGPGDTGHQQRDAVNLEILRDQLRELDADRAAGTIDDASYQSARHDLELRVVNEVRSDVAAPDAAKRKAWSALALGLLVPAVAAALYFKLGNTDGLDPTKLTAPQSYSADQINAMVQQLAQRMKQQPDDAKGWAMLARSYVGLGRYAEAADAYAHLVKLSPENADLLADYADAMGMANNRSLQGEPEKIIDHALAIDPKSVKALALSGGASFERHDYHAAVTQWRKILALVPPNSDIARSVAGSIDQALTLSGMPADARSPGASVAGPVQGPTSAAGAQTASAGATVAGTVELDPAARSLVKDDDTVFIFAKAVGGPPMPLAVLRKQVKDLPAKFVLDDSMSMMPGAKLSGFPDVIVGAKISRSGSATPGEGDFSGSTATVHPGATGLKITIGAPAR
jgi:cytochrome c-type biogenesis protein CcmH